MIGCAPGRLNLSAQAAAPEARLTAEHFLIAFVPSKNETVPPGAIRGARDLIAFSVGPCVSAGVISHGALLSGAHGVASSVAWLALNPVERDDYRRLGCLEAEAGSAGIVRRLIWRIKSGDRSRVLDMVGGNFSDIHLDHILKAIGEAKRRAALWRVRLSAWLASHQILLVPTPLEQPGVQQKALIAAEYGREAHR